MSDLYGEQYLSEEAEDFMDALSEHDEMEAERARLKAEADQLEKDFLESKPGKVLVRYQLSGFKKVNDLKERMKDRRCPCFHCEDSDSCEFAFDPYNSNGDCLAIK